MQFLEWIKQPWPWYVAGPLIGLTVPLLLIMGNKAFGVSSSLRHICAACIPANIPFFKLAVIVYPLVLSLLLQALDDAAQHSDQGLHTLGDHFILLIIELIRHIGHNQTVL